MDYKDYYQTLGVSRSADEKEIKKAFRKLAQQYHPDRNPGDKTAEQKFKEINEAYTVLSDADKRSKYDRFGSQWEQFARAGGQAQDFDWSQWRSGASGGRGGYSRTVTPEEFEQIFGNMGGGGGFSSFFDTLFGGAGGGPRGGVGFDTRTRGGVDPRMQTRRAQQAEVPVQITLEEAYSGTQRLMQTEDGSRIEASIPKGVKSGSRVRMARAAGAGDVYLKIEVLPHDRFTREDDNLRVTVPVDLLTAVLGGEVEVPTLERPVVLKIPAGTQNGRVIRLRGQGMPQLKQPDQRGDLLAIVAVELPTKLSEKERALFEELRRLRK